MAGDSTNVNPDLLKERKSATFDVERMCYFLNDGETTTSRRRALIAKTLSVKVG